MLPAGVVVNDMIELPYPEWRGSLQEMMLELDREELAQKTLEVEALILQRLLMHIQSTTTFHESLHHTSSAEAIAAPRLCYIHCYSSFPIYGYDKRGYLYRRGSVLPTGSISSDRLSDLQAIAIQRCL
jgi:hypothetical protein